MPSPSLKSDEALTVVVVDDASEQDATRLIQQVVKTAPHGSEIILLTHRSHRLPAHVSRRVRTVRTTREAYDVAIAEEVARDRMVVVTTAAASFSPSWCTDVAARATLFPGVISAIDSRGSRGVQLVPSDVVTTEGVPAPWLTSASMRLRPASGARALPEGPPTRPERTTISAVLIVKDEEDVLDECLRAVADFVDEIIVYDTGSRDSTLRIARRHDAVVIEGYWDDHFGNARNRALEHATMDWVLQVDADEVAFGDPVELRAQLAAEDRDHVTVGIVSSAWQGVQTGLTTYPVRLFRRGSSRYVGALHEYPMPLNPASKGYTGIPAPVRFMHSGYHLGKVQDRDKTTRNIELSRRELEAPGPDSPSRTELLSNLARSLMWAGRVDEAVEYFRELRATPGNPTAMVMSGRAAFDVMLSTSNIVEADAWIEALERHGEALGNVAVMRARRHMHSGDFDAALASLDAVLADSDGGRDPWGVPFERSRLTAVRSEIYLAKGNLDEGIKLLLELAARDPEAVNLDLALRALVTAGRPLTILAAAAPEAMLARSVREAALFHPSGALAWFNAVHEVHPGDPRFVVAGNLFAERAGWETALVWSVRARELGIAQVCALRGLAERESAPQADRCLAWLLLAEYFGEDDAAPQFQRLVIDLDATEQQQLIDVVDQLADA